MLYNIALLPRVVAGATFRFNMRLFRAPQSASIRTRPQLGTPSPFIGGSYLQTHLKPKFYRCLATTKTMETDSTTGVAAEVESLRSQIAQLEVQPQIAVEHFNLDLPQDCSVQCRVVTISFC
jgi:hypothetical protein